MKHNFQDLTNKTNLQIQEELSNRTNEELIEIIIHLLRLLSLHILQNGE